MIEIRGLHKHFAGTPVLRGVELVIAHGEFVAMLGLSGAGKTTLLRCLNGLVAKSDGELLVAGMRVDAGADLRTVRRHAGFVFQHFNLVGRLSALDNVLTGRSGAISTLRSVLGRYSESDRSLALDCLERVGLGHKAESRADTLSGGEKQRVAIARALVQQPAVILADEPVSSVDPVVGRQILGLLRQIAKEDKITVLCNLHNVEFAREFAERIVGLADGVVVFDATPAELTPTTVGRIYTRSKPSRSSNADKALTVPPAMPWMAEGDRKPYKARSPLPNRNIPRSRHSAKYIAWGLAALLILAWSAIGTELSLYSLAIGIPQMLDFFSRLFPPDLEQLPKLVRPTLETVQIAIWGTLLAVLAAIPIGLLAAQNVMPVAVVYWAARGALNACRGVSELVFALMFVSAVGLGPFPGVLALAVHNFGMLGKFYGDVIEGVDPGPIDALCATGARRIQVIRWAIFPQIFPEFIAFNLYRFEVSIRAATVLGLVGAGGIGFNLITSLRLFRYQETTTILILIVFMVIATDFVSTRLRRRII